MLISFAVTEKLICVFVITYAKCLFSHDAAQRLCTTPFGFVTNSLVSKDFLKIAIINKMLRKMLNKTYHLMLCSIYVCFRLTLSMYMCLCLLAI